MVIPLWWIFNENTKKHVDDVNVESNDDIQEEDTFNGILDCEICGKEVRNAIRHLKAGTSAGPDCILAEMLKMAEPMIVPCLKKIFNVLFVLFPEEWSKAINIPLHKKGDKNNPPISHHWTESNSVLNDA